MRFDELDFRNLEAAGTIDGDEEIIIIENSRIKRTTAIQIAASLLVRNPTTGAVIGLDDQVNGEVLDYEPRIGYTLPNNVIEITASQIVVGKSAKLHKISCISASAIAMTVYDNQTAVEGTAMWTQTYNTGDTVSFPGGMLLINGIYAVFTGTATFQMEVSDAG